MQIIGNSTGMLKLMFHRETRKLLDVSILGEGASELIRIGQTVMARLIISSTPSLTTQPWRSVTRPPLLTELIGSTNAAFPCLGACARPCFAVEYIPCITI
jgi:hypothetical protein